MEKGREAAKLGEGSGRLGNVQFWKTVWNLQVPNASKVFLWRACSNILPTKDNLHKRGAVYVLFQGERNYYTYSMGLPIIQGCVEGLRYYYSKMQRLFFISFMEVMETIMARCSKTEMDLFTITVKKIWASRNAVFHGGVFQHLYLLLKDARELLQ